MKLKLILKEEFCRTKNCPSLYQSETGDYYIQGYSTPETAELSKLTPKNERIVRVSGSLLRQIAKNFANEHDPD